MRLLVIEDKEKHQKDAQNCLEQFLKNVSVDFATSYEEAMSILKSTPDHYDGILSDVFSPRSQEQKDHDFIKKILIDWGGVYVTSGESVGGKIDSLYQDETPYGILVGSFALEKGWPIVLITDTYHHGEKTEPINGWSDQKRIPLVDREVNEESCKEEGLDYFWRKTDINNQHVFSKKDWLKGFLTILWMIEGKNKKLVEISKDVIKTSLVFGWASSFLECMKPGKEEMWKCYHSENGEASKEAFKEMVKKYLKKIP